MITPSNVSKTNSVTSYERAGKEFSEKEQCGVE